MLLIPRQKSGTPRLELNRRVLSPLCFGAGIGAYGLEFHEFFLMQDFLANGTCNLVCSASNVFFLLTQVYFIDKSLFTTLLFAQRVLCH